MSFIARLFGFSGDRREAPGAAPQAPPSKPEPAPLPLPIGPGVLGKGEAAGLSHSTIADALRAVKAHDPDGWAAVLAPAMAKRGIDTPQRAAMFLANVLHETGKLKVLVESLNYSVDGLLKTFGRHRIAEATAHRLGRKMGEKSVPVERQKALAMILYGGDWGFRNLGNLIGSDDGWMFRGHGLIQLTGRRNFEKFGAVIGRKAEELPPILCTREGAAESAAHFFAASGCCGLADAGALAGVRKRINGGTLGLAEVETYYHQLMAVFSAHPR